MNVKVVDGMSCATSDFFICMFFVPLRRPPTKQQVYNYKTLWLLLSIVQILCSWLTVFRMACGHFEKGAFSWWPNTLKEETKGALHICFLYPTGFLNFLKTFNLLGLPSPCILSALTNTNRYVTGAILAPLGIFLFLTLGRVDDINRPENQCEGKAGKHWNMGSYFRLNMVEICWKLKIRIFWNKTPLTRWQFSSPEQCSEVSSICKVTVYSHPKHLPQR